MSLSFNHSTPHVFFAVVQSGSMAEAAAQFRVKQPSVSATITFL
jgi:DNA-binding transcriptional LysR family regulator